MRVILRPTGRSSWSGLIKYRNCYEDIAPYFTRSGRIYTGLTELDESRLGEQLGEDLRPSSEFWKNFFIRTTEKDLYLDTSDPRDELKWLFLKNHKRVKNSLTERKATANFVLINKDEEARRSNIYNKIRREAVKAFDDLSPEDMRKCLRLYGHNADSLSNEVVENRLFDIVEANPQSFLDRWVNNEMRENEVLVERAISRNVIRRNKNVYKYGTEIIGHNLRDTAAYLGDPKNQDIKITIMKQLESKRTMDIPVKEAVSEETVAETKAENGRVEDDDSFYEEKKLKGKAGKPNKKGDTI